MEAAKSTHASSDRPGNAMVERARSLWGLINAEAAEIERARRLTRPVVEALRESELIWALVGREQGGLDLSVPAYLEVLEELCCADGSVGWCYMAMSNGTCVAASFGSDAMVDRLFGDGRKPIVTGMYLPGGVAVRESGDFFRASGKFGFGSASDYADWIACGFFVEENGKRLLDADGSPIARAVCFPPSEVEFIPNWDVFGLIGTGSNDFRVEGRLFREDESFIRGRPAQRGGTYGGFETSGLAMAGHVGVVLGLMKRALIEIGGYAPGRKRAFYPSGLHENAAFTADFGHIEALYQGARAFTFDLYGSIQARLDRGDRITQMDRNRLRQNVVYLHSVASEVVKFCYVAAGTASLRNPSPLGRCMRDTLATTQHVHADLYHMPAAGKAVLAEWSRIADERRQEAD